METSTGPAEVEVDLSQDAKLTPDEFAFMGRFLGAHAQPDLPEAESEAVASQAMLAVLVARQVPDIDIDSLGQAIREGW